LYSFGIGPHSRKRINKSDTGKHGIARRRRISRTAKWWDTTRTDGTQKLLKHDSANRKIRRRRAAQLQTRRPLFLAKLVFHVLTTARIMKMGARSRYANRADVSVSEATPREARLEFPDCRSRRWGVPGDPLTIVEEAQAFGQDTDAALNLKRMCGDIKPADGGLARSGSEEPGKHLHSG